MKKIILLIGFIFLLLISSAFASNGIPVWHDPCNSDLGWQDNSGMTLTFTGVSPINVTSCKFTSGDGKIMSYNTSAKYSNAPGVLETFNMSARFRLDTTNDYSSYMGVTSSSTSCHWRDGAMMYINPSSSTWLRARALGGDRDFIPKSLLQTSGTGVTIMWEFNNTATDSSLEYNLYVNGVKNLTNVRLWKQSCNFTDLNGLGAITVQTGGSNVFYVDDIRVFNHSSAAPPAPPAPLRNETITFTTLINETQNNTITVLLENYNLTSSSTAKLIYGSKVYGTNINHVNNSYVVFTGLPVAPLVSSNATSWPFFFNYSLIKDDGSTEKNQSSNQTQTIQQAYFLTGSQVFGGVETVKQNFNITMTSAHIANTELIGNYNGLPVTEFENRPYGFIMNVTAPLVTTNNTQIYGNATLNVSFPYWNQYNFLRTPETFNHWVLWIAWLKNATLTSSVTETQTTAETVFLERYDNFSIPFSPNLTYIYNNVFQPSTFQTITTDMFNVNVAHPLVNINHTSFLATATLNITYSGVTKTRELTMNTTPLSSTVDWGYYVINSSFLRNITETLTQTATTFIRSFNRAAINLNYNYNKSFVTSTNVSDTYTTKVTAPKVSVPTLVNYTVDLNVTFNGITYVRNFTFT